MATIVQDFFTSQKNNVNGQERIGKAGRLWYEPETNTIRVSDGITPGGIIVSGGGGTGGGIQGPRGYIGSRGAGFTGSQGAIGNVGYAGSRGDTGFIGSQGSQGNLGYTGSIGNRGYVGSQGELGYAGSTGDLGYTGSEGAGYTGSVGELGYVGSQGDLGYTGSEGFGYAGSRGIQGLQGPKGDSLGVIISPTAPASDSAGELWYDAVSGVLFISYDSHWVETTVYPDQVFSGATAPNSPNNNDIWYDTVSGKLFIYYSTNWIDISSTGSQGYTGSAGYQGRDGYTGSAGYIGQDGYVGSAGASGRDGYTGSAGYIGQDGYVGSFGYTGSTGYTGSRGAAGVDGKNVTASTTAPVDPIEGQLWYDTVSGRTYVYYSGTWVAADPTELTTVSNSPPTSPTEGTQWYDTVGGRLYIYYNNNWVDTNPVDTTGFVGSVAGNGYTGSAGSQGTIGYTGSGGSGVSGGYAGSAGDIGYVGSMGELGYVGSTGNVGYIGSLGNLGYTGSAGELGYVGSVGELGYVGSVGELGYVGSVGELGYVGSAGIDGSNGYTGSQSYTGSRGYIGSFGYAGSQGPLGYTGSIPGTYVSGITAGTGTVVSAATGAVTVWMNTGTLVTNAVNLTNAGNTMRVVSAPSALTGASENVVGDIAFDANYIYRCFAAYDNGVYTTTLYAAAFNTTTFAVNKGSYGTPTTSWTIRVGTIPTAYSITNVVDSGAYWSITWSFGNATVGSGATVTLTSPTPATNWTRTPWMTTGATASAGTLTNFIVSSVLTATNIVVTSDATTTATNNGALVVRGGVGIAGGIITAGAVDFGGKLTARGNIDIIPNSYLITNRIDLSTSTVAYLWNTEVATANIATGARIINMGYVAAVNISGSLNTTAGFTATNANLNNGINVNYNPYSTVGAAIFATGGNTQGGTGYFDFLKITHNTGTNVSKSFRLNNVGTIEIINSAYSSTVMSLSDAGVINVASSYQVAGKKAVNGPAFRAYVDTNQTIAQGAQRKVTFGTENFDTDGCFASSTFTPTVEGYYQFNATVRISGTSGTGEVMLILYKNGTEYARGTNEAGTEQGVSFYSMSVSDIAYANGTTDNFEVYIQQSSGGDRTTTAGSAISHFSGVMVRGA